MFFLFQITTVYSKPFSPGQHTTSRPSQGNLQTSSDYNGGGDTDATAQPVQLPVGDKETSSELFPNSNDLVEDNLDVDRAIRDIECVDSPPNVVIWLWKHILFGNMVHF